MGTPDGQHRRKGDKARRVGRDDCTLKDERGKELTNYHDINSLHVNVE